MPHQIISIDDPRAADVRDLLGRHVGFALAHTPRTAVHALDVAGLLDPALTFYSLRVDGELFAVGAIKQLDASHAELKSMHVTETARGRGFGRAMLEHLVGVARERGLDRLSLETGTMDSFGPARALYASAGFVPCEPFGNYSASPHNTFMTMYLMPARP